ncbi:hypothetical protein ABIB15_001245 [Marisediminicola sp. UYEF4]|uniref:hypothetical protein n=1 Tax=Marisediminicola sp. UYEF4 TaxID=1756384 RepID=UPI003399AE33
MEERPGTDPDNRAQLLATEHSSVLASRGTTQSEVLTRINMFLTFASAGLVSLALVGQATDFAGDFAVYSIVILGVVTLVGALTQVRVTNVSMEDLMYVVAMNRLRASYLELEPTIAPFLMSSPHDDLAGVVRTYYFLGPSRGFSQIAGSSVVFIAAVNSAVIGLLAAAAASSSGAPTELRVIVGAALGIAYFAASFAWGASVYFRFWRAYTPQHPTPEHPAPHHGGH